MKPVIGISFGFHDNEGIIMSIKKGYINLIKEVGGVPILLPPQISTEQFKDFKQILNGILLSGGGDIDPDYFGEEPEPLLKRIDPVRDKFELDLTNWALAENIPLLGICRGIQVLNVACGGTIIQHLADSKIKHDQNAPYWYPIHKIILEDKNRLKKVFGQKVLRVNSFHHQSVGEKGTGIISAARAPDGVMEAIIKTDHPFALGLQWHPEHMYKKYPEQIKPFQVFIKECEKRIK